jgi:hypothetical protein
MTSSLDTMPFHEYTPGAGYGLRLLVLEKKASIRYSMILDFGLARQRSPAPGSTTAEMTEEGTVMGTVRFRVYVLPEFDYRHFLLSSSVDVQPQRMKAERTPSTHPDETSPCTLFLRYVWKAKG